jgi:hypothetical protein
LFWGYNKNIRTSKIKMNQKISTSVGTAIIIIIAITVGMFVWKYEEIQSKLEIQSQTSVQSNEQQQLGQQIGKNEVVISEPIGKWRQCRNTKVGYEVKYPGEWETRTKNIGGIVKVDSCNTGQLIFTKSTSDYQAGSSSISITYEDMREGTGLIFEGSKSLSDYFEKMPEMVKKLPIVKETLIDNERAVYLGNFPNPRVLTYHKDRIFDITGVDISEKTFTDFLSTFKFLE